MSKFQPTFINNIKTPEGRIAYPHLDKPDTRPYEGKVPDRPKHKADLLIPKEGSDFSALRDGILKCAQEAWPEEGYTSLKDFNNPLKNGDKRAEKNPEYANMLVLSASKKARPTLVDINRNQVLPEDCYPGVGARFVVTAMSYRSGGNNGVSCILEIVQLRDQTLDRFGGGGADVSILDDDESASGSSIDDLV